MSSAAPDGWLCRAGQHDHLVGEFCGDFGEETQLVSGAGAQQRVGRCAGEQALVHDPGGGDAAADQVFLEVRGLVDRCRLGQGDEQDMGTVAVSQPLEQVDDEPGLRLVDGAGEGLEHSDLLGAR